MKATEFITEGKKGRRAVKYNGKPRNPVAHAAQKVAKGSGPHKDKKKADKQGDAKHKKELATMEAEGVRDVGTLQTELQDLQKQHGMLENAVAKARKITSAIKHESATNDIIVQIKGLAEQVGLDDRDLGYLVDEVMTKEGELQSAVFALDDVFTDKLRELSSRIDELEWEIDDYQKESIRNPV